MSSLANEQFCYLTTPEEYALQRYEGGNTLYGPQSQPFVAAAARALAADLARHGQVVDPVPTNVLDFPARRFLAEPTGRRVEVTGVGAPAVRRRDRARGRLLGVGLARARAR